MDAADTPPTPARTAPPHQADEATTLLAFLDFHRSTLLRKVDGLDTDALRRRLPPSTMTLAGLVKHLAMVEDNWFAQVWRDERVEPWASAPWDDDRDWEWTSATRESPAPRGRPPPA